MYFVPIVYHRLRTVEVVLQSLYTRIGGDRGNTQSGVMYCIGITVHVVFTLFKKLHMGETLCTQSAGTDQPCDFFYGSSSCGLPFGVSCPLVPFRFCTLFSRFLCFFGKGLETLCRLMPELSPEGQWWVPYWR